MALSGLKKEDRDLNKSRQTDIENFINPPVGNKKKKAKNFTFPAYLPKEHVDFLDAEAEKIERSRSYLLQKIVKAFYDGKLDIKDILS
ncbi:MAG: hypothetical protein HWN81_12045 [Candidatus Lokiarchaeota archaeon]|nr:hypothetical protein [Candidatus Lokiarchaeota archaeon]